MNLKLIRENQCKDIKQKKVFDKLSKSIFFKKKTCACISSSLLTQLGCLHGGFVVLSSEESNIKVICSVYGISCSNEAVDNSCVYINSLPNVSSMQWNLLSNDENVQLTHLHPQSINPIEFMIIDLQEREYNLERNISGMIENFVKTILQGSVVTEGNIFDMCGLKAICSKCKILCQSIFFHEREVSYSSAHRQANIQEKFGYITPKTVIKLHQPIPTPKKNISELIHPRIEEVEISVLFSLMRTSLFGQHPEMINQIKSLLIQDECYIDTIDKIRSFALKLQASLCCISASTLFDLDGFASLQQRLILSKFYGPIIFLIDSLDLRFPSSNIDMMEENDSNIRFRFMELIQNLDKESNQVLLIGLTSNFLALDKNIRKVFGREFIINNHSESISGKLISKALPLDESAINWLEKSGTSMFGKTNNLVQMKKHLSFVVETKRLNAFCDNQSLKITDNDLIHSRDNTFTFSSPSNFLPTVSNVNWEDIGGLHKAKQALHEMLVWPLTQPEIFDRMGIRPSLGIILHGPPGTGKTMLAKAAAKACGCRFIALSPSNLIKSEVGESEKLLARVFEDAKRNSPCLIFIDEFQSIFPKRSSDGKMSSKLSSQLLLEMDKLRQQDSNYKLGNLRVTVLAATNCIDEVDKSVLQPGRFDETIYIGAPSYEERIEILSLIGNRVIFHENVNVSVIAEKTEGFTASELTAVCERSILLGILQGMQKVVIDMDMLFNALSIIKLQQDTS